MSMEVEPMSRGLAMAEVLKAQRVVRSADGRILMVVKIELLMNVLKRRSFGSENNL